MKNVLITGGANGIGYECASIFADDGNNVYVIDIDQEEIEKKQKINKKIKFYCCDVSNYKKMEEIANQINTKIDVLINCAGIQIVDSFEQYDQESWQQVMNTNYFGICNSIHIFKKYMKEKSTILNLASIHSSKPRLNKYAYDSSKNAVIMLTKELGIELSKEFITINALSFGAVETKMNSIWNENILDKEIARSKVPMGIIFKPQEIASFAYKIIRDFSEYTTGSVFTIDGGRSLT